MTRERLVELLQNDIVKYSSLMDIFRDDEDKSAFEEFRSRYIDAVFYLRCVQELDEN